MKKNGLLFSVSICLLLIMVAVPLMAGCAQSAPAPSKTIDLSLNLQIPPLHPRYLTMLQPWAEEIESRSGGRLHIEPFFSNALSPAPEIYDATVTGLSDIGEAGFGFMPGRFPLTEVAFLPRLDTINRKQSTILWELYKAFPEVQAEFGDAKILMLEQDPMQFIVSVEPIRNLEDLQGKKVMSWGKTVNRIAALGGAPVSVAPGEIYSSLEKGVADALIFALDSCKGRNIFEVATYITRVNLSFFPWVIVMNRDKYESLPRDLQKVIDQTSGDWAVQHMDEVRDQSRADVTAWGKESYNIEIIDLPQEELARWIEADGPVREQWVADMKAEGLPGAKVLAKWDELLEQYGE
ncbi:TRAP transporter substrate-binding protein [Chloroflexota bacterium]